MEARRQMLEPQKRRILKRSALSVAQRSQWDRLGFVVLPQFFRPFEVARMNRLVDDAWHDRHRPDNPLVIDVLGGELQDQRMYLRDLPDDAREHPYKLNDLYLESPEVRRLVLNRRLRGILGSLLGGSPAICNSLNFERGSQQDLHFDTYYMPGPCPDGLVATWICLEDVHPDAGPLTFYPGSHVIPPYRFSHGGLHAIAEEMDAASEYAQHEVARRNLVAEDFVGRKGDVFIWHEQLYHGGRPIRDTSRTRRSLVTHYWRVDTLQLHPGWELRSDPRAGASYLARHHQPVPQHA